MKEQKALEVLKSWSRLAYHNADGTDEDSAELYEALQTVFDLITRQQAEIEALIAGQETLQKYIAQQQARIDEFMKETAVTTLIDDAVVYTPTLEDYNKFKKKFKYEAVKEVFEKLKDKSIVRKVKDCGFPVIKVVTLHDINSLQREMAGDNS